MNEKTQKLYTNLSSQGYKLGTPEEFSAKLSDPVTAEKFYNNITKDGYRLGKNFGEFSATIGLKKKEVSPSVSGGSTPVAGGSEQMLAGEKQEGTGISELAPQEYWRTPVKLTADQIDPKNQKTLLNRTAYNYAAKKDYAKSNELITQGLKADPEDPYLNRLAYFNAKKQNDPNLRTFLERAAQTNPEDPVILHDLGVFAFNEGKKEDAYLFAEKALTKINPTTAEGKRASSSLLGILATIEGQEGGDPTPFLEKKVQLDDKIKEEDEKWYNNPNPANYILSQGVNNSMIGMALRSGLPEGSVNEEFDPYRNYAPSEAEEFGANVLSILIDSPTFMIGGGGANIIAKPLIQRAYNAVMNRALKTALQRGLSREATNLMLKRTANGFLKFSTGMAASMAENAGSLSVYSAARDVLGQVVEEGKDWEDISYSQTLKEFGKGAVLGLAVGATGYGTKELLGATTSRLSRAGIKAAGFAAENAVFVGGGAMLEGKPLSEITGKDWLTSAATLGILKGVGILKRSTNFSKEKVNKGEFNVELTPEELKAVGEPTTEDAITKLSDPAKMEEVLLDSKVPNSLKAKAVWAIEGVKPEGLPAPESVTVNGNTVETFGGGKELLERKEFESTEEADAYATQAQSIIKDRKADELAASLTPEERVEALEIVKSSGIDLNIINTAKDKSPETRTPEEVQALRKFNETVNSVRKETITKGGERVISKPIAQKRTYDEIQNEIDAIEEKLEQSGQNPYKMFDATQNKASDFPEGYEPMPEELASLYRERFSLERQDRMIITDAILSKIDLSPEDAGAILSDIGLGPKNPTYRFAEVVEKWDFNINEKIAKIYNWLSRNVGGEPVFFHFVLDPKANAILQASDKVDPDVARKTEKFYNAIAHTLGKDMITLRQFYGESGEKKPQQIVGEIKKGGENAVSERTLPENGEQEHQQVSPRGETTEAGDSNRIEVGGEVKAEEKITGKEVVTPPEQPGALPISLSEGVTGKIDNGTARFFDTEGKELVPRSAKHRRAKKEYFDQLVLDNGKETSITEDLSPDEYLDKIATSSENPAEVFNTYVTERERSDSERIGTKEWAISQAIGRFGVDPEQLRDVWKSADEKREVRFYLKHGGAKLDQIAQQASDVYRPESDAFDEITPQDVFDFMKNYPAGPQQYFGRTPLERSLAERFEMLTGIKLNKTTETDLLNKTRRIVDSGEWGDDVAGRMTDDALFAIDEGLTAKNVDALFGVVSEEEFNTIKQAIKITEKNEEQGIGTEAGGERPVSDVEVGAEGRGAEETKGELAKELDDQIAAKRQEITDTTNEKNLALEKVGGEQDMQLGVPSSGELGLGVERAVDRATMDRVAKPYDDKIAALERDVADLEQRRQSVGEGDLSQTDVFEPPREATVKEKFKSAADKLRSNKIQEGLGGTASAGIGDTKLWNDILESMAVAVETTGDIAQAIKDTITSMRTSKEYLALDSDTRSKFERKLGGVWDTAFPEFVAKQKEDITKTLTTQYGDLEKKIFGSRTATAEDFAQSKKTISSILSLPSKAQEATFGKLADVVSDKLASGMSKALASQNMATRNAAKLVNSIIKDIGKPEALVAKEAEFKGKSRERAAADAQKLTKILTGALGGNKESLEKLDQVLDPEWYENPIKYEDLAPHEQHVYDLIRSTYDYIHDLNFAMGKINVGTYLMNKGKYSARLYDSMEFPEDIQDAWERGNSSMFTGMYKGREEIDEWKKKHHIANPIHGVSKRLYQTLFNKAIYDYAKTINEKYPDVVSPTERKGFTKLGGGYGDLSNKFVRDDIVEGIKGFFYTNKTLSALNDAFTSYNRSAPRKFYRGLFTKWNPGVQLGNHTGNIPFSMLLGISPMRFEYNFWHYARKEAKNYGPTYRYLLDKGLLRSDLTRTDLAAAWENMAKELDKVVEDPNMFQKLKAIPGKAYSANDDLAKLAAFKSLMDMGYKPEKAVQFIREAYQNFNRVGKFYDFASKMPAIGNMFAKWGGDLFRISKLGITRRPLNLAAGLGTLHLIAYLASVWSGESENERKIREGRPGFPKIPMPNWLGGDIPLAIKIGDTELNLARFVSPLYIYSTPDQDDVYQLFQRFLPVQIPVPSYTTNPSGKGAVWMSQFLKDPIMSPIVQTALNADWKGAPILDPNETIYKQSNLSNTDKIINAVRFLARAYVPYGAYGDDFIRALTGNPDYYGRTKTPGQVALRFIGWNSQQFKEDRYFRTLMNEGNMVDSRMKSLIESAKSVIKARDLGQITQAQYHRREAELLEEFAKQVSKMKAYKEKAEPYLSRKSMAELEQLSREYQMGKKK